MEIAKLLEKVFPVRVKADPDPPAIVYHDARWVSLLPELLRIDRQLDVPFSNITWFDAYVRGDQSSGDRFLVIGLAPYSKVIRVGYPALSPDEFRFPGKSIDVNMRHVLIELMKNIHLVALSDGTIRFMQGNPLPVFPTQLMAHQHIASFSAMIGQKIPLRCGKCKKFTWVEISKIPLQPVRAKCPSCNSIFELRLPPSFDRDLEKRQQAQPAGDGAVFDFLPAGPRRDSTPASPGKTVPPPGIDVDLGDLLGPSSSPPPPPPLKPELPDLIQEQVTPAFTQQGSSPFSSAAGPKIELDDDFLKNLLPDEKPASPVSAPAPAVLSGTFGAGDGIPAEAAAIAAENIRTCHICGAAVGNEKICPQCFTEVMTGSFSFDGEFSAAESGMDIRLKDIPAASSIRVAPDLENSSSTPLPESGKEGEAPVTIWEERIWSIKAGEEVFENLDMKTIEQWIMEQTVKETDLIRKGETRWKELGTVPYFRNAFRQVRETIRLGSSSGAASFYPARPANRIIAMAIDLLIVAGTGFLGNLFVSLEKDPTLLAWAAKICAINFIPFLYLSFANGVMGRTVGKAITKTGVINTSGQPIGLLRGCLRTLVWYVTFGWGFLFIFADQRRQALHDRVVNSYVIQME